MKKKIVGMLALLSCASLFACGNNCHEAKTEWKHNETQHWHECSKEGHDDKLDVNNHTFEDWVTETSAGYGSTGLEKQTCSICGYSVSRTIAALDAKDNSVTIKSDVYLEKEYDGEGIGLIASDFTRNGDGAITLSYKRDDESEFSFAVPKKMGTYEVKVSVAATAEWKECETTVQYQIRPKGVSVDLSKNYDGNDIITGSVIGAVKGDDVSIKVTMDSKNVGATIKRYDFIGADAENYYLKTGDQNQKVTIKKKILTFEETNLTKEYDGTSKYHHIFSKEDGLIDGDNCEYSLYLARRDDKTAGIPCIDAGHYTDLVYNNDTCSNDNYQVDNTGLIDPQGTSLTITKKVLSGLDLSVTNSEMSSWELNEDNTINREIDGVKGEKIKVSITFRRLSIESEGSLSLVTGSAGQGEAKIEFDTTIEDNLTYKNYAFADSNIGTIRLDS